MASEGDRELLFLEGPANRAAKTLGDARTDHVTKAVFDALPSDLQAICIETDDPAVYAIAHVPKSELDALCAEHDVAWNREDSRQRLDEDRKQFPLSDISIESADVLIELDLLSIRKSKRVSAASLFADLTGFTAQIERACNATSRRRRYGFFTPCARSSATC